MRALIQRVSEARVEVDGWVCGQIGRGLLVLGAAGQGDGEDELDFLVRKISELRIFADEAGKFNRSLLEIGGAILLVSQFTLYADCRKGRRPSFSNAAPPDQASPLLDLMAEKFRALGLNVQTGSFGAMMRVHLVNEGPVTIWLDTDELKR